MELGLGYEVGGQAGHPHAAVPTFRHFNRSIKASMIPGLAPLSSSLGPLVFLT